MIIVSGAKRTGTSLMMQMLSVAGFTILGEKFPEIWNGKNNEKNPEGFYESKFIDNGLNNNNCQFVPEDQKMSAVKIFCDGLPNTDFAYIDKVILMVREWKEQVESWKQLAAINEGKKREEIIIKYPDGYDYFHQYIRFLDDYFKRNYKTIIIDYNVLLEQPKITCDRLREFLGVGRWDLASQQVKPKLYTVKESKVNENNKLLCEFLDKLYAGLRIGNISKELITDINSWRTIIYKDINKINENWNKKEKQPIETKLKNNKNQKKSKKNIKQTIQKRKVSTKG